VKIPLLGAISISPLDSLNGASAERPVSHHVVLPESHIFISFADDFGRFLFRVDSDTKNRSGLLKHIVHVVIMRNTRAISIREIVRDLTPGGENTVASFDLGRGMHVLDREGTPLGGKEIFCITLTVKPDLVIKPAHVEVPRGHSLPPERLDLDRGIVETQENQDPL
jgi:hypothetical protein